MRLKVEDKVRIERPNSPSAPRFSVIMNQYNHKEATIREILLKGECGWYCEGCSNKACMKLDINDGCWWWADSWLIPVSTQLSWEF